MAIQIADFYVCIIQIYIFSNFVCRINKMKYGYLHSICYHMMRITVYYSQLGDGSSGREGHTRGSAIYNRRDTFV